MEKRLRKGTDRKICGVCSGLGEYFNIDPTIVRLIAICTIPLAGSSLLAYIIAAIIMPD